VTDEEFQAVISKVVGAVVSEPEMQKIAGSGKVFAFGTIDGDVNWYIDAGAEPVYREGTPERFDVRASLTKDDWIAVLAGKLSPTQAMLRKKLKVEGSVITVMSLPMDALLRCYKTQLEGQSA
jgi:putative sterol carrier protein